MRPSSFNLAAACLLLFVGRALAQAPESTPQADRVLQPGPKPAPDQPAPPKTEVPAKPPALSPVGDTKSTALAPAKAGGVKPNAAAQDNDATRILKASADAIRRARVITYSFRQSATGGIAEMTQDITADMRMTRRTPPGAQPTPSDPWFARAVGEGGSARKRTAFEVVFFREPGAPDQAEWLDEPANKLLQRTLNAPGPMLMLAKQTRFEPLFADLPFSKELNGATAELLPREQVDGVECDAVSLTRGANNVERWYIATTDHLPRQHVKVSNAGAYSGEIIRSLSAVMVEEIDQGNSAAEALRLTLPDGYTADRTPIVRPTPAPAPQGAPGPNPAPPPEKDAATPTPRPSAPTTAPDFEIPRLAPDAERVTRDSIRGSVAAIEFYGSWNVSLDAWHPLLEGVSRELTPKGAKFFAASVRERSRDAGAAALRAANAPFDALVEGDAAAKALGLRVFPAVAVLGKDGEILALVQGCRGERSKLEVQNAIERGLGLPITPAPTPPPATPDEKSADNDKLPIADAKKPEALPTKGAAPTPASPAPTKPAPTRQSPTIKPNTPTPTPRPAGLTPSKLPASKPGLAPDKMEKPAPPKPQ